MIGQPDERNEPRHNRKDHTHGTGPNCSTKYADAGILMFMLGGWWIIAGLVALFNGDFYVVTKEWIFELSTTSWGWIHLILGIVVLFARPALPNRQLRHWSEGYRLLDARSYVFSLSCMRCMLFHPFGQLCGT